VKLLLDSFWRAAAYCLHPRVIALSVLPLLFAAGGAAALGYFYWEAAVAGVREALDQWSLVVSALDWLESVGATGFRTVLAPLLVVVVAVPLFVVASLLLVALLMTPALVELVAKRRFPDLTRKHGAGFVQAALWSLLCTLLALVLLVATAPLWLIPPLVLVVPPMIWGWLTYRVMTFEVLGEHASSEERREIMREHRWPLLGMGIIAGYLGAAPSLLWAASAMMLVFAPLLLVLAVWIYTLVFAFSALWFAHYALAALQALRAAQLPPAPPAPSNELPMVETVASPPAPPALPLPLP